MPGTNASLNNLPYVFEITQIRCLAFYPKIRHIIFCCTRWYKKYEFFARYRTTIKYFRSEGEQLQSSHKKWPLLWRARVIKPTGFFRPLMLIVCFKLLTQPQYKQRGDDKQQRGKDTVNHIFADKIRVFPQFQKRQNQTCDSDRGASGCHKNKSRSRLPNRN